jgi:hypothetical protein
MNVPILLVGFFLVNIHFADAQQPKKFHRIGYLSAQDPARASTGSEAIRLALRELGYIEGQNIAIVQICGGKGRSVL